MLRLLRNRYHRNVANPAENGGLGFRVSPDVKASLHPEGVVLIHHGRGTVFSANLVGAMIWNGALERWSIQKLTESISNRFQISPQTAQQDTAAFLSQLEAEGLLIPDPT